VEDGEGPFSDRYDEASDLPRLFAWFACYGDEGTGRTFDSMDVLNRVLSAETHGLGSPTTRLRFKS